MGNLCTKKKVVKTFDDFSQSDIDETDDLNFADSVLPEIPEIPEIPDNPGDTMVKEYLEGNHDTIDRMTMMGDSFIIPKAKKIRWQARNFSPISRRPVFGPGAAN